MAFAMESPSPKPLPLGARRVGAVESVEETVCGERPHSGIAVGKLQLWMLAAGKLQADGTAVVAIFAGVVQKDRQKLSERAGVAIHTHSRRARSCA